MRSAKVSVIIAANNCEEWLTECLDSIQRQTFSDWEILACDDASIDSTADLLAAAARSEPRVSILRHKRRLGAAASRNACLAKSAAEYVAIQDADDLSEPDRLAVLLQYLRGNPDRGFVGSGMYLFDQHGTYGYRVPRRRSPRPHDFLWGSPFCHATTVFRRAALATVRGYRVAPETIRGQDYDLFMRLYAAGIAGSNLRDCLYGYREGRMAYERRRMKYRLHEVAIRYKGFASLRLLPWALHFVLKPLAASVIPRNLMRQAKRLSVRPAFNRIPN